MKTATIIYLCMAISMLAGLSFALTWGMRAYTTHVFLAPLVQTQADQNRLDQAFDQQISAASGGATIVLFQAIAIYYVRKLKREAR